VVLNLSVTSPGKYPFVFPEAGSVEQFDDIPGTIGPVFVLTFEKETDATNCLARLAGLTSDGLQVFTFLGRNVAEIPARLAARREVIVSERRILVENIPSSVTGAQLAKAFFRAIPSGMEDIELVKAGSTQRALVFIRNINARASALNAINGLELDGSVLRARGM
jgi:hypothetical protein